MPWARIDDGLHANEKFAAISLGATGLWTLCLSWTTDQLKDGFIPKAMVTRLGGRDAADLVSELVQAGLWDEVEGGYQVHNYLEYNLPAEKVIAEREAAKARMTRRRSEQKPNFDDGSADVRPNFARSSPSPTPHTPHPIPTPIQQAPLTPPGDETLEGLLAERPDLAKALDRDYGAAVERYARKGIPVKHPDKLKLRILQGLIEKNPPPRPGEKLAGRAFRLSADELDGYLQGQEDALQAERQRLQAQSRTQWEVEDTAPPAPPAVRTAETRTPYIVTVHEAQA